MTRRQPNMDGQECYKQEVKSSGKTLNYSSREQTGQELLTALIKEGELHLQELISLQNSLPKELPYQADKGLKQLLKLVSH